MNIPKKIIIFTFALLPSISALFVRIWMNVEEAIACQIPNQVIKSLEINYKNYSWYNDWQRKETDKQIKYLVSKYWMEEIEKCVD